MSHLIVLKVNKLRKLASQAAKIEKLRILFSLRILWTRINFNLALFKPLKALTPV